MHKPVLIVIDMLHDFFDAWAPAWRKPLVEAVNELVATMRDFDRPVIWVRQEFEPDLSDAFPEMRAKGIYINIKGTRGCQILDELTVEPQDRIIVKKRYSAFYGTNLDEVLSALGPDAIILAGINTHACIRMAAIDAYQRDWPVVLASECIDSYDREHHEISLRYMQDKIASVMTNAGIRSALTR
jgi:nicotinamidase-related amidase